MKIEKDIKSLISWAKKYMTTDSQVKYTSINRTNVLITLLCMDNNLILSVNIDEKDFISYLFNENNNKWVMLK